MHISFTTPRFGAKFAHFRNEKKPGVPAPALDETLMAETINESGYGCVRPSTPGQGSNMWLLLSPAERALLEARRHDREAYQQAKTALEDGIDTVTLQFRQGQVPQAMEKDKMTGEWVPAPEGTMMEWPILTTDLNALDI